MNVFHLALLQVRRFIVAMLGHLRAVIESGAVRVGLVRFADRAVRSFDLNTYPTDFTRLINAVRTAAYIGGGTNTGLGRSTLLHVQSTQQVPGKQFDVRTANRSPPSFPLSSLVPPNVRF